MNSASPFDDLKLPLSKRKRARLKKINGGRLDGLFEERRKGNSILRRSRNGNSMPPVQRDETGQDKQEIETVSPVR